MSTEDLKAFFARLQQDAALRDQALAVQGEQGEARLEALSRLARGHGFDVTPADLAGAADVPGAAELDDGALSRVTGAAGVACDAPGIQGVTPDIVVQGF